MYALPTYSPRCTRPPAAEGRNQTPRLALPLWHVFCWCLVLLASPVAGAADEGTRVASSEQGTPTSVAPEPGPDAVQDNAAAQVVEDAESRAGDEVTLVDSDTLRQRAQMRWGAMIDNDFYRAYEFCSPAYRALYTPKEFVARFGSPRLDWKRVEVIAVQPVGEEAAQVKIKLYADAFVPESKKPVMASTVFAESWVRADGQWWYIPAN